MSSVSSFPVSVSHLLFSSLSLTLPFARSLSLSRCIYLLSLLIYLCTSLFFSSLALSPSLHPYISLHPPLSLSLHLHLSHLSLYLVLPLCLSPYLALSIPILLRSLSLCLSFFLLSISFVLPLSHSPPPPRLSFSLCLLDTFSPIHVNTRRSFKLLISVTLGRISFPSTIPFTIPVSEQARTIALKQNIIGVTSQTNLLI